MLSLKDYIREVPDFPKKGINFKDLTPLLNNPKAYNQAMEELIQRTSGITIQKVIGIESRGFLFAPGLAQGLNAGFVPVRKPGKLPSATESIKYQLEYGTDVLEIHRDAILPGETVLIHDDLLATGGTAKATCELVERLGGKVIQLSFIVELGFLKGRDALHPHEIHSLISY